MADERAGRGPGDGTRLPGSPAESTRRVPPVLPPRSPVRWGIGDFFFAALAGIVGATIASVPFLGSDGTIPAAGLVASMLGQAIATLGFLELIARVKGRGSLAADFGLALSWRDLGWLPAGVGFAIAAGLALLPVSLLAGSDAGQEIVKQFEDARGATLVLFALGVVVVAPITEELVYRGLLLRSLLRRVSPVRAVFLNGLIFGVVHVVSDPGAYVALPALVALGCLAAVLTVRSGNLSRAILLHAGFNFLTTVQILGFAQALVR